MSSVHNSSFCLDPLAATYMAVRAQHPKTKKDLVGLMKTIKETLCGVMETPPSDPHKQVIIHFLFFKTTHSKFFLQKTKLLLKIFIFLETG